MAGISSTLSDRQAIWAFVLGCLAVTAGVCAHLPMFAMARAMLYDPRWPWHAAAQLGATVEAPPQYWRSQPRDQKALFGETTLGQR